MRALPSEPPNRSFRNAECAPLQRLLGMPEGQACPRSPCLLPLPAVPQRIDHFRVAQQLDVDDRDGFRALRDAFGGHDHDVGGSRSDTVKVGGVQAGREDKQRPWKHEQMC
jgi:hypothetical protein